MRLRLLLLLLLGVVTTTISVATAITTTITTSTTTLSILLLRLLRQPAGRSVVIPTSRTAAAAASTDPAGTATPLAILIVPLDVHLLPPQHLDLVAVTHGQLVDGGVAVGVEHVDEAAAAMSASSAAPVAAVGVPIGKHVDVVDGAELLEEGPDLIGSPLVRAVGDEELAPLVEGGQGAPGRGVAAAAPSASDSRHCFLCFTIYLSCSSVLSVVSPSKSG